MNIWTPYSLLGFPVMNTSASVQDALSSANGNFTRLYEFNNTNKQYNIYLAGLFDDIGDVWPDLGYWILATYNTTVTIP